MLKQRLISIIVPLYNECKNLPLLYEALQEATKNLHYKFEIIFVDDGSADGSADCVRQFAHKDDRIRLLEFARNFGKEAAVSAGLHAAKGEAAIMIDADMQMPPERIGEFIKKWEAGAEVVVGVFSSRNMAWLRRTGAAVFYKVMSLIGNTKITPHATDFRLLDRQVIDAFTELSERNRITRGLIDWLGFRRDYVYFEQAARAHGEPTYSMTKLIGLAVNSFTSYSFVPLKLAGYLGIFIVLFSTLFGCFIYTETFLLGDPLNWAISGSAFLATMILFLVGVILVCLGLMSLYIAQIQTEVINRPLYVLRKASRAVVTEGE